VHTASNGWEKRKPPENEGQERRVFLRVQSARYLSEKVRGERELRDVALPYREKEGTRLREEQV